MFSDTAMLAAMALAALLLLVAFPFADKRPPLTGRDKRGGVNLSSPMRLLARGSRATMERCAHGLDVLLVLFFRAYCAFVHSLYRMGAPAWLVNAPRCFVPDLLMSAAASAYRKRKG